MKRIIGVATSLILLLTAIFPTYAAEGGHVIVNQVYGASDDGYTDNNAADFEEVNYSKSVSADKDPHAGGASVTSIPSYTPVGYCSLIAIRMAALPTAVLPWSAFSRIWSPLPRTEQRR